MKKSRHTLSTIGKHGLLLTIIATLLLSSNLALFPRAQAATPTKMIGINGAYNVDSYVQDAHNLGVQWMRVEQWNDNAVYDTVPSTLNRLSAQGIRMLPLVNNDYKTGWVTAADKTTWTNALVHTATTYGAGGSYWQGKTDLGSPVIEVGNEVYGSWFSWPNQSYLYPGEYAKMLKQAAIAVTAATNGRVKLLASVEGDYLDTNDTTSGSGGTWKHWATEMKAAVPDIESYLGGVVVHPYGDVPALGIGTSTDANFSHQVLYTVHSQWNLPVYVTEVGQKGPLVGFDKQAAAVTYYFNELKNNPWEAGLFWYNQKDNVTYSANGDNGWALIDSNDTREPAWTAYQTAAKAMEAPATGNSDVNGDGKVNALDLSIVLSGLGTTYTQADLINLIANYNP